MRQFKLSFFILITLAIPFISAANNRSRVEELFIWKISDEMKLSVPEEKSFSDFFRKLNQKKIKTNEKLQDLLKNLAKATTRKEKEKLLVEHRKLLKEYNDYTLEEADEIQKLFGSERAAQYFVLKNDLTLKLKNLLAIPEKPTGPVPEKMAPPVVVEQK